MSRKHSSNRFHAAWIALAATGFLVLGVVIAVPAQAVAPVSIFGAATPAISAASDPQRVELGVRFRASVAGTVTGVRFYKGPGNTGTHTGSLWRGTARLATGTFSGETASGWQTLTFATPVAIAAGTVYTASYLAPNGHYAVNDPFSFPAVNGNLTATRGVYKYGGGYPTDIYQGSNYWVDVVFTASVTGGGTTPVPPSTTPPVTTPPTSVPTAPPALLNLPQDPQWVSSAYYKKFAKADAAGWDDPTFFPIAVFFGKPEHAPALKSVGVNTYMGAEHDGSTMKSITDTGMFVLAQTEWTRAEVGDNARVVGWHVADECDMGYSGCTPDWNNDNGQYGRLAVEQGYVAQIRGWNDGRLLQSNYGNGVLRTYWAQDTMDDHVRLVDVSSVDKYAYTSPHVQGLLPSSPDWPSGANPKTGAAYGWLQDQMERFQGSTPHPNWVFVETSRPYLTESNAGTITVAQIEGAVWAAIIHGAKGIAYFQHSNAPDCGGYSLVQCSQTLKDGVKAIDAKVASLATVINSPTLVYNFASGTDTMLKAANGSAYIFAQVGLNQTTGTKTFTLPAGISGTAVEVVGEGRTVSVSGGKFIDTFSTEAKPHIYRITI